MRRWMHWTLVTMAPLALALASCGGDDGAFDDSGGDGGTGGNTGDGDGGDGGDSGGDSGGDDGGTGGDDGGTGDDGSTGPVGDCGNGELEGIEECDDANMDNADSCTNDCALNEDKTEWDKTADGSAMSSDVGFGIVADSAGNIIIAGYIEETDTRLDIFVRKCDPDGTEIWTETHDGGIADDDRAFGIAIGTDDSPVVVGRTQESVGNADIFVRKYDPDGMVLWDARHDDAAGGDDQANGVAVDIDGNVVVAGEIRVASGDTDIWVRKYDGNGTELWTETHDGAANGTDVAHGVATDSAGNIAVAAHVSVEDEGDDVWVRKYDAMGAELWTHEFGGGSHAEDHANAIAIGVDDTVVYAGHTRVGAGHNNVWVQRLAADDGAVLITHTYNGPRSEDDRGRGVVVDADDNILVIGHRGITAQDKDIWIRQVNTANQVDWTMSVGGDSGGRDEGHGIALDPDGNILVVGEIRNSGDTADIWSAKLTP